MKKNLICASNEQLFSGVKRSKVKVKALKAEATTVFVFLIIVVWCRFSATFLLFPSEERILHQASYCHFVH